MKEYRVEMVVVMTVEADSEEEAVKIADADLIDADIVRTHVYQIRTGNDE